MTDSAASPAHSGRGGLVLLVVVGAIVGVAYACTGWALDDLSGQSGLVGALHTAHEVIDLVLPVVAGVLLGIVVHSLRTRSAVATVAAESARELRTRLQRVERDQAAWVVAASTLHEVRNPLHALGLLLDEVELVVHDDRARDEILLRARAQMDRIADHLSKLRSVTGMREPEIGDVDLGSLVEDVVRGYAPGASLDRVEIVLSSQLGTVARGDPACIRIVLDNLLRNGVEALRDRGGGRLSVEVARGDGEALVRVRDDGPGVPSADHSGIFVPLRTTKEGGLGLGLSIGRALARSMRGDLVLETSRPGDTRLCLRLPGAP